MEIVKGHCNKCGGERRQEVLCAEKSRWDNEEAGICGGDTYEMIKCCGCEGVSLRHSSWFSEDFDNSGNPKINIRYYPPAAFRQDPRWLPELIFAIPSADRSVHDLLQEIYVALQNDSLRLATMGIRALLEHVMVEKVGDQGSFKNNLDAFESQGFISRSQRNVMEPVLEAGHATMHRSFKPTHNHLVALIDITENIIESIYINLLRVNEISKTVPPRARKP